MSQCMRLTQTDRETDGRRDRQTFLITTPRWHSMQRRGKNFKNKARCDSP